MEEIINFLKYRLESKFNIDNKNPIFYETLEKEMKEINNLDEIPYDILFWVKIFNKPLFNEIIKIEQEIIQNLTKGNKTKFNNKLKKYKEVLNFLVRFYKINKIEAENFLKKRRGNVFLS